ncbi:hypothetical protein HDV05_003147 [Chytridiales sp. JEL 0842]|nr:hypothetical protein HDV05_003147 [Chytridiales sp. JEL 0842]
MTSQSTAPTSTAASASTTAKPNVLACIEELKTSLPPKVKIHVSGRIIERRSHDLTYHTPHRPDAVVQVNTEEEVSAFMRICNKHKVPVIPLAGGTSIEGHTIPTDKGGIVLDVSNMDKVIAIHDKDMDVVVQPGVGWMELKEQLAPYNLFFPPDPGAAACIGGMAGCNCSGTLAFRYGTMKDNVLSLRVVLPDGTIIKTRNRAVKSSAGYDLTRFFVGSEGTLGVITQATLRLRRVPTHSTVALAQFPSLDSAAAAVLDCVRSGDNFQRLEIIDDLAVRAVNNGIRDPTKKFKNQNTLLVECAGFSPETVQGQLTTFRNACTTHGSSSISIASSAEEAERLWDVRKKAYFAAPSLRAHEKLPVGVLTTDVAVPVSRLVDILHLSRSLLASSGLVGPIVAHAGDGNFHSLLVVDTTNPTEIALAEKFRDDIAREALKMGGTVTGEHGIGSGKMHLLEEELGPNGMEFMKKLKRTVDPNNILNPGKIFRTLEAAVGGSQCEGGHRLGGEVVGVGAKPKL